MHSMVIVKLGEADFYNDAMGLQCHAMLNANICSQHAFGSAGDNNASVDVDVTTVDSLGLFYRVSRPLYLDIDVCDEAGLTQGLSNIGPLIAQQVSSDQFWCQLNFRTVSVRETEGTSSIPLPSQPSQQPGPSSLVVRTCLGLEHVDHVSPQPSPLYSQGSGQGTAKGPILNINDINYPDCLELATLTRVSLRLRILVYKVGKSSKNRRAEAIPIVTVLRHFVDAAIRCSVSSARHRLVPGIRRAAPGFEHTLQTTFPAIFSPLGLRCLAERQPLISGIARNILSCVTASQHDRHPKSTLLNLQQPSDQNNALSLEDIESRLWNCVSRAVRDTSSRLVLKPLLRSDRDPVPADEGSSKSLFHLTLSEMPSTANLTDILDYESALDEKSVLLDQEDPANNGTLLECLDTDEEEWGDLSIDIPHNTTLEGMMIDPDLIEADCSRQKIVESNSDGGVAESMLMDDEFKVSDGYLSTKDESVERVWDHALGDSRSPSEVYSRLDKPTTCLDEDYSQTPIMEDCYFQYQVDATNHFSSSPWSFMLDTLPAAPASPEQMLTPPTSFAHLDLLIPNQSQDRGFSVDGNQQIVEILDMSPPVEGIENDRPSPQPQAKSSFLGIATSTFQDQNDDIEVKRRKSWCSYIDDEMLFD